MKNIEPSEMFCPLRDNLCAGKTCVAFIDGIKDKCIKGYPGDKDAKFAKCSVTACMYFQRTFSETVVKEKGKE